MTEPDFNKRHDGYKAELDKVLGRIPGDIREGVRRDVYKIMQGIYGDFSEAGKACLGIAESIAEARKSLTKIMGHSLDIPRDRHGEMVGKYVDTTGMEGIGRATYIVRSIIAREASLSVEEVHPEMIFGNLNLDSLDNVKVMIELEDEFEIGIPDGDWQGMNNHTIRDIASYVLEKRNPARLIESDQ